MCRCGIRPKRRRRWGGRAGLLRDAGGALCTNRHERACQLGRGSNARHSRWVWAAAIGQGSAQPASCSSVGQWLGVGPSFVLHCPMRQRSRSRLEWLMVVCHLPQHQDPFLVDMGTLTGLLRALPSTIQTIGLIVAMLKAQLGMIQCRYESSVT